tara:strand:+ start:369 stop:683 length:315 start_codon:yes stop_codon:yes gene_type:complete
MTILEITTNQSIAGKALIENGFKEVSSYFNDNIYSKDGDNYKITHPVWTKDLKAVRVEKRKSLECSKVLQLMDQDLSYSDALKTVLMEKDVNQKDLENELNIYI